MNTFYSLHSELSQSKYLNELTSASAIAFLPGGFTPVTKMLKKMSKKKSHWNLEILDEGDHSIYTFENGFKVAVQRMHQQEFFKHFVGVNTLPERGRVIVELPLEDLLESKEVDADLGEFSYAFYKYLSRGIPAVLMKHVTLWKKYFGVRVMGATDAFVDLGHGDIDGQLESRFIELVNSAKYSEDDWVGACKALKAGAPWDNVPLLQNYVDSLGARLSSRLNGVSVSYSGVVATSGLLHEEISSSSPDALTAFDEIGGVKVVGPTAYPRGKAFSGSLFKILRDEIKSGNKEDKDVK